MALVLSRAAVSIARSWCFLAVVVGILLARTPTTLAACTSGVIQLIPPTGFSRCFSPDADRNSLKAICGAAFRVTVANSIIRLAPLELGSFNYTGPGPEAFGRALPPFDCKNHNASGLFLPGSTTAATLMLYDELGGLLSNFTKTGPNRVSLAVGRTESYREPPPKCTYDYTVVSGCVLGAKPATPIPAPCPRGFASKTGRFGIKYCAPCPQGTYSPGGAAKACLPCPIGTSNSFRGAAVCTACPATSGEYAPRTGLTSCKACSRYDGKWTDGKTKCGDCPAGSTPSGGKPSQCVRCYAGKKCCTVNWDKTCPRCTSDAKPKTYTSIFALESATPAACLASPFAVCSPKINITIDGTCNILVNNLGNANRLSHFTYCTWDNNLPIQGAVAKAVVDLAQLNTFYDGVAGSLIAGNVTGATSPFLVITYSTAKCTFRYRALTSPAAKILNASPKPNRTPVSSCPAGKYIDTTTDTKPGPCLPCPAGFYSTKAGTKGACTACPAGTYASKLGSTACTKCPRGQVSQGGLPVCSYCEDANTYARADGKTCSVCPLYTTIIYPGAGACLGSVNGTLCCGAGLCSRQATCNGKARPPPTAAQPPVQAILRLISSSLSGPTCRDTAAFLSCLPAGTRLAISGGLTFQLRTAAPFTCAANSSLAMPYYSGGAAGTNRAVLSGYEDIAYSSYASYELLSNRAAGTVTMYLSSITGFDNAFNVPPVPAIRKECSATFELVFGSFLDLQQPQSTTCPASAVAIRTGGRTLCRFCDSGSVKDSAGACQPCPPRTYQSTLDGGPCKPCPAGFSCMYAGQTYPQPCGGGSYAPKPGSKEECIKCPAGTFAGYGPNKACTKCPKGTIAPAAGSSACGVPWATKF